MRLFVFVLLCLCVSGCNSVYLKPSTLDTNQLVYTQRGGYSMQRSIKQIMEERGYKVHVGTLRNESSFDDGNIQTFNVPAKARYTVYVKERTEILRPVWCLFNGFWWWNFSLAISDRKTGTEILSWRGRGCQNSSLRKLNAVLDELEMKESASEEKPIQRKKTNNKQKKDLVVLTPKRNDDNLVILANPDVKNH